MTTKAVHGIIRGHIVTAAGVLRDRLAKRWTLASLTEEAHVSRSQLVRAFNATLGISPMAYLRQMRVEQMARVLASTDVSVAEIARSVGWADAAYASRCFHAHYGMSPTAFRWRQGTLRAASCRGPRQPAPRSGCLPANAA